MTKTNKKRTKIIVASTLAIAMGFTLCPGVVGVNAQETAVNTARQTILTLSDAKIDMEKQTTGSITVSLSTTAAITSYQFTIALPEFVTVDGIENQSPDAESSNFESTTPETSPATVTVIYNSSESLASEAGLALYTINFSVNAGANDIEGKARVTDSTLMDADANLMDLHAIAGGTITVGNPETTPDTPPAPTRLMGDIDNDGDIDMDDLISVQRHIIGAAEITAENLQYADINHDGLITLADAQFIQSFLVKRIQSLEGIGMSGEGSGQTQVATVTIYQVLQVGQETISVPTQQKMPAGIGGIKAMLEQQLGSSEEIADFLEFVGVFSNADCTVPMSSAAVTKDGMEVYVKMAQKDIPTGTYIISDNTYDEETQMPIRTTYGTLKILDTQAKTATFTYANNTTVAGTYIQFGPELAFYPNDKDYSYIGMDLESIPTTVESDGAPTTTPGQGMFGVEFDGSDAVESEDALFNGETFPLEIESGVPGMSVELLNNGICVMDSFGLVTYGAYNVTYFEKNDAGEVIYGECTVDVGSTILNAVLEDGTVRATPAGYYTFTAEIGGEIVEGDLNITGSQPNLYIEHSSISIASAESETLENRKTLWTITATNGAIYEFEVGHIDCTLISYTAGTGSSTNPSNPGTSTQINIDGQYEIYQTTEDGAETLLGTIQIKGEELIFTEGENDPITSQIVNIIEQEKGVYTVMSMEGEFTLHTNTIMMDGKEASYVGTTDYSDKTSIEGYTQYEGEYRLVGQTSEDSSSSVILSLYDNGVFKSTVNGKVVGLGLYTVGDNNVITLEADFFSTEGITHTINVESGVIIKTTANDSNPDQGGEATPPVVNTTLNGTYAFTSVDATESNPGVSGHLTLTSEGTATITIGTEVYTASYQASTVAGSNMTIVVVVANNIEYRFGIQDNVCTLVSQGAVTENQDPATPPAQDGLVSYAFTITDEENVVTGTGTVKMSGTEVFDITYNGIAYQPDASQSASSDGRYNIVTNRYIFEFAFTAADGVSDMRVTEVTIADGTITNGTITQG